MAALQPQGQGQPPRGQLGLQGSEAGPASPGSAQPAGVRGRASEAGSISRGSGVGPASLGSARPAGVRGRADLPGFRGWGQPPGGQGQGRPPQGQLSLRGVRDGAGLPGVSSACGGQGRGRMPAPRAARHPPVSAPPAPQGRLTQATPLLPSVRGLHRSAPGLR